MAVLSKNTKISDELTALTARLMLCTNKSEIINLSGAFGQVIERVIEQETQAADTAQGAFKATSGKLQFSKTECAEMDSVFRKQFVATGRIARVIKRKSGVGTYLYEIRYRRNGYNVSVSSTDMDEARRRFLIGTRTGNVDKYAVNMPKSGLNLFRELAVEWLEYKRGKVCERTHENYESYYRRYVSPALGNMPIKEIRTADVDKLLKGKGARLYEDLRTLVNSVFKYAIASGIITHNPVTLIPFIKAERQSERRALTKEEQERLFEQLKLPEFTEYRQAFTIMLYFGLRPCEVYTARVENGFLIARNAKRKNGKIEYKKIPICKEAKDKLSLSAVGGGFDLGKEHRTDVLNRIFKRIMQDEAITQYYLRHTFATTCQMYVRPDIVDIWMGDSAERLVGRVYTHFSDEFMQAQMDLVRFDLE